MQYNVAMNLTKLNLKNYRNCRGLELDFNKSKILIIGKNAQGKTNILESIYFLSCLKSQRTSNLIELINFDALQLNLEAELINLIQILIYHIPIPQRKNEK